MALQPSFEPWLPLAKHKGNFTFPRVRQFFFSSEIIASSHLGAEFNGIFNTQKFMFIILIICIAECIFK
jgi:hypothetical protein